MSALPLKPDICERDWGDCGLKNRAVTRSVATEARGAGEEISPRQRFRRVRSLRRGQYKKLKWP